MQPHETPSIIVDDYGRAISPPIDRYRAVIVARVINRAAESDRAAVRFEVVEAD